jgi:hypothetical protein
MPELPLTGGCACGAVRFSVSEPLVGAGYCHCHRCQDRTGTAAACSALVADGAFTITAGAELVAVWRPEGGKPKSFCSSCGGALWAGEPDGASFVAPRLGAFDGDPGVRPAFRQWVSSAAPWEPLPDDGLPRFAEGRTS